MGLVSDVVLCLECSLCGSRRSSLSENRSVCVFFVALKRVKLLKRRD